jgi:hypothetical protein
MARNQGRVSAVERLLPAILIRQYEDYLDRERNQMPQPPSKAPRMAYSVEPLAGGCKLIRLGKRNMPGVSPLSGPRPPGRPIAIPLQQAA